MWTYQTALVLMHIDRKLTETQTKTFMVLCCNSSLKVFHDKQIIAVFCSRFQWKKLYLGVHMLS